VEVNEVAVRLLRRYWFVFLAAVAVPFAITGAYVVHTPASYTAHTRLVASATTPRAQAEAAAVVSQVQAIATSRDIVTQALADAHVNREVNDVISRVVVTGLGSSALVDLAYTDRSPAVAQQVAATLATTVGAQLDALSVGGLPAVLKNVDDELTSLAEKRAPIASQAQAHPQDAVLQNRLAGIDRLISDLSGDRDRLAEEAAAGGHATVVASAVQPPADSKGLAVKLAVATLFGLILGLLLVGINEMLRPAVAGASRVARLLEVPVLGVIGSNPAALNDVGQRVRLAGRRASVSTVVLVRTDRTPLPPELVDRVNAATMRPESVPGRISIPMEINEETMLIKTSVNSDGARSGLGSIAVLPLHDKATPETNSASSRLRRVCALDELDPSAEGDDIGLVVVAGGNTRIRAVDGVRDLLTAAGWPLLGVLDDGRYRGPR
jgi:uncharacterized protein involved in exopolysaccharide biosynthesis